MDNETSGMKGTLEVSANFSAKDADLLLISKDNVVFRVHRLYLEAHSPVFKDMFELGRAVEKGAELPEVQLEETSGVLEICLPYIYPARLDPFKLELDGDFGAVKMFHKYELARGAEAVLTALDVHFATSNSDSERNPRAPLDLAAGFAISSFLEALDVRDRIVKYVIDTNLGWRGLKVEFQQAAAKLPSSAEDCSKLAALLNKRKAAIEVHRRSQGSALMYNLCHLASPAQGNPAAMRAIFRLWEDSAYAICVASFIALRKDYCIRLVEARQGWLPSGDCPIDL
ncbi:hypothetical protein BCR35DRAFT_352119, partial [Leucosporidium creatinivorum]